MRPKSSKWQMVARMVMVLALPLAGTVMITTAAAGPTPSPARQRRTDHFSGSIDVIMDVVGYFAET